jgi:hypothetical protein
MNFSAGLAPPLPLHIGSPERDGRQCRALLHN